MKRIFIALFFTLFFFISSAQVHAQTTTQPDKLIKVDLAKQVLTAWKDGLIQYRTPVSTGMYLTPTVRGSFTIQSKIPLQDMRGPSPYKNIYPSGSYLVKNVPNVMYFYQAYAIHGAYWHNNFGRPASHGCVNVPLLSAQWLYDWADVGTRVEIF